ncbi:hypothetical protein GCM10010345_65260 [Streptomyces canarius]|uniref:Uncharacterized protein n=1 Tax=Streptomyces canarius TaxID=285453 RepID=A0ABQ3D5S4_9ACTN|nr:hypothetical protein GCM10010345_65260 [Streptomyces canarius]
MRALLQPRPGRDAGPGRYGGAAVVTAPGAAGQAAERCLLAEMVGLLNDAEHYAWGTSDQHLAYLERRAKLLHRLVDVTGDESSRYLAQDADDRSAAARAGAAALAAECGDPKPAPRQD